MGVVLVTIMAIMLLSGSLAALLPQMRVVLLSICAVMDLMLGVIFLVFPYRIQRLTQEYLEEEDRLLPWVLRIRPFRGRVYKPSYIIEVRFIGLLALTMGLIMLHALLGAL